MINLVRNELFKVIKKKGFIIMVIVMLAYAVLTNFIYKTLSSYILEGEEYINEDYAEMYDVNNREELPYYVKEKTSYDLYKLRENYKKDSWQYNYLVQADVYDILYRINSYENKLSLNEEDYKSAKEEYDVIIKKLDTDDWKEIVESEKKSYEEQLLTEEDTKTKKELEIRIEEQSIRLDKDISYAKSYLNDALMNYIENKITLLEYEDKDISKLNKDEKDSYFEVREQYLANEYALENNVDISTVGNLRTIMGSFFNEYLLMLVIMIFMIAGSITSQEFSKGTIKLLLLKPYSRVKILLSKYITVILSIFIAFIIMFIIQLVVGGIFFGFDSLSDPMIIYSNISDYITIVNVFKYVFMTFIGLLPCFLLLATLAFAASTLFTNTALAVVIGFVGYIGGNMISELLISLKYWWIKYIFCFNWNLTPYIFNYSPSINGVSMIFSIVVCVVYLLLLLVPTFILFKRKDITNV